MRIASMLLASGLLAGCGGSAPPPDFADPDDPAYAAAQDRGTTDPRVSTSGGEPGGYVVLWPRIIPSAGAEALGAQAAALQERLAAMATEAAAGRPVDVRPEPERVCPRDGCAAASVGAVLLHQGGSCAVVAVTARPGRAPAHLAAWAGRVDVLAATVPFREPPEERLRVGDLVPCRDLAAALDARAEEILREVRAVRRDPV